MEAVVSGQKGFAGLLFGINVANPVPALRVFVSYSHKDANFHKLLTTHLGVLQHIVHVDAWDDTRIKPGENLDDEIREAMERADIALLLLSADYLSSNYVTRIEIPKLLSRREKEGLEIIPIVVRDCLWKSIIWLNSTKALPADGESLAGMTDAARDTACSSIAEFVMHRANKSRAQPAYTADTPPRVTIGNLPSTGSMLVGREREIEILEQTWARKDAMVLAVVAWGGCGKSALLNHWLLRRMAPAAYRGARRIFAWSFYSQGANEQQSSSDAFFESAFAWFKINEKASLDPLERGRQLAQAVRSEPTLLILDGLEPLQFGPGFREGRFRDPAMLSLLRELAAQNNGLCVITTRVKLSELSAAEGGPVRVLELQDLEPDAGAHLLQEMGVRGTLEDLKEASEDFGGHALALTLLGSYLASVHGGDVKRRSEVPLIQDETGPGRHANRVLRSYEIWLGPTSELSVLKMMGLFDRPAAFQAVVNLRDYEGLESITAPLRHLNADSMRMLIARLRSLHLILEAPPESPDTLDMHPLVRAYFSALLRKTSVDTWKLGNECLYRYYRLLLPEKPSSIREITLAVEAVGYATRAGLYEEALQDIYVGKIEQGRDGYLIHHVGAPALGLIAVGAFFSERWTLPVEELDEDNQGYVLNEAAIFLDKLGRPQDAIIPQEAAAKIATRQKNWTHAARAYRNLARQLEHTGNLQAAEMAGEDAVAAALKEKSLRETSQSLAALAWIQFLRGKILKSKENFRESEKLQKQSGGFRYLVGINGQRYCLLLVGDGHIEAARTRNSDVMQLARKNNYPADIVLAQMMEATCIAKTMRTGSRENLLDLVNSILDGARKAGDRNLVAESHVHAAEIMMLLDDWALAAWLLDQGFKIADDSRMSLLRLRAAIGLHECAKQGQHVDTHFSLNQIREELDRTGYEALRPRLVGLS